VLRDPRWTQSQGGPEGVALVAALTRLGCGSWGTAAVQRRTGRAPTGGKTLGFSLQVSGHKRPSSVHGGRSYFRGPALGPLAGASRFRLMRAAAAAGRLSADGAALQLFLGVC
jgi:hypothetical protein